MLKIAMITGSYPPVTCGVGDYTARLVQALISKGLSVKVFSEGYNWGLFNSRELIANIQEYSPDIIHIQYPTTTYGHRLGPQFISLLKRPCVVTLHEVSQTHILRRLSLYPFAIGAERVIFTTSCEMNYARKWAPWLKNNSKVIPIGSFLSTEAELGKKDIDDVVYFGLVRPKKGIENIINLARIANAQGVPLKIRMIGLVEPKHKEYFEKLKTNSKGINILWDIGLPESEVAGLLSRVRVAYMPFPDGASERRSSLLALLASGVVTVTTKGEFTCGDMLDALTFASTEDEALKIIVDIQDDDDRYERLSQKALEYSNRHGWDHISSCHIQLYKEII